LKIGIVLEGGGMRGIYSTGVLDSFLQAQFMADEVIGVSAGASIGISYVSMQNERGLRTTVNYAGKEDYLSLHNFVKTKSLFGMDYIFGEIPEKLDSFDYDTFRRNPCTFFAGATDVRTGKTCYFGKEEIVPPCTVLRASCSLPVFSPIVHYQNGEYLDGGLHAPIPIDKALADGCDKIIIVLTRERGYRKKPQVGRPVYAHKYRHYPALVHVMDTRHKVYNTTLDMIQRMEHDGEAIIAAPDEPLPLDRFGTNHDQLLTAYRIGLEKGKEALYRAQEKWGITLPRWPKDFPPANSSAQI